MAERTIATERLYSRGGKTTDGERSRHVAIVLLVLGAPLDVFALDQVLDAPLDQRLVELEALHELVDDLKTGQFGPFGAEC